MADAKLQNLARIQAKLRALPPAAAAALKRQLKTEADDLVAGQRRAAPVQDAASDAGKLRDSIHAYPNPRREISMIILADAKDAKGKFIGSNIEAGHRTVNGGHVAGRPSFYPTYRARKKGMKRRLSAAARAAIRAEYGGS